MRAAANRSALASTWETLSRVSAKKVAVATSGGKDSVCTLDVCVRHFGAENVVGFLMYKVPDLQVEWAPIRKLEARYGIKVIGVPHWVLSRLLKYGIYRPPTTGVDRIKILSQTDVEDHVRKVTGADWVAWGRRATDSLERNAMLRRVSGADQRLRRVDPLWEWRKRDVYGYLHARKLPIPAIVGGGKVNGGVNLRADTLAWLEEFHPEDYAKVLRMFPHAAAAVYRLKVMGIDPDREAREMIARMRKDGRRKEAEAARIVRDAVEA